MNLKLTKEIVKIGMKTNKIENKQTAEQMNKAKVLSLQKMIELTFRQMYKEQERRLK